MDHWAENYSCLKIRNEVLGFVLPLSAQNQQTNFMNLGSRSKAQFLGWLLQTLKTRSQKNTSQMFFQTLVEEWRGKSHRGMDISGKMGQGLCSKTYRRHKRKALQRQQQRNDTTRQQNACVWWVDNFNKFFIKSYLGNGDGPKMQTAWTALALVKLNGIPTRALRHRYDNLGAIHPAYPVQLFKPAYVNPLKTYYMSYNNYQNSSLWQNSVARNFFSTPLRMPIVGALTQEQIVYGSNIGLKDFYPVDLLQQNISSTGGLCDILRFLRRHYWRRRHYFLMKVDINIYWRMAKVCIYF